MSLSRQLGKVVSKVADATKEHSLMPTRRYQELLQEPSLAHKFYRKFIAPWYFRAISGPFERYQQAVLVRFLREHGLLYDDMMCDREPMIERALALMTPDLKIQRFRRIARGIQLNLMRMYLPLEEQNYDPFVPYLAPFVEEAKFQLQEEEELLGYHPVDRRLFVGGTTGFGDLEPGMHFLTSFPNMFGAGMGNMTKKK